MVKVTPHIRPMQNTVPFANMPVGQVFKCNDELWIKTNRTGEQIAVCLDDGCFVSNMCSNICVPVDAEIKWSKPK